jgi:hypothetical protein
MNRETEARLLEFAARQHRSFVAGEWLDFDHPEIDELAAAALFLAGVDWYGHRRELLEIASIISPGSPGNLGNLVARTGFDLSRFSNHLRRLLDHAVAPS